MLIKELKHKMQQFLDELKEHRDLYASSLDSIGMDIIRNNSRLEQQINTLNRTLGELRPFIQRFASSMLVSLPPAAGGQAADAFTTGVGNGIPILKGPCLDHAIATMHEVMGHTDRYKDEDNVPEDKSRPIKPGTNLDHLIQAYLPHLHPMIQTSCEKLYLDAHYASAILNASTTVTQVIRNNTGLDADGDGLITQTFSPQKPILKLNPLKSETDKNEQLGFMMLLQGFNKMIRNVYAHEHDKQETPQKAFEILVTASFLCHKIDTSQRT